MKVVYVDTSVLICVFLSEHHPKRAFFTDILNKADEVLSANLLEAEFLSVIKREGLSMKDGLTLLRSVSLVIPERSLEPELKRIFDATYLRGADAYHLAVALYVDETAQHLRFLTLDKDQEQAAQQLNFAI